MAFLYEQFIGPLPATFIEFCVEWKKYFPVLYDTKCVSIELTGADKGGKTNLEDLYEKCLKDKAVSNNLQFKFDVAAHLDFGKYQDTYQAHNGGFDAYMTGIVFASLTKKLEINSLLEAVKEEKKKQPKTGKASGKKVQNKGDGPTVKVVGSASAEKTQAVRSTRAALKSTAVNGDPAQAFEDIEMLSRSQSALSEAQILQDRAPKQKAAHYTSLQNRPIDLSIIA